MFLQIFGMHFIWSRTEYLVSKVYPNGEYYTFSVSMKVDVYSRSLVDVITVRNIPNKRSWQESLSAIE